MATLRSSACSALFILGASFLGGCGDDPKTVPDTARPCEELACDAEHRVCTQQSSDEDAVCGACVDGFTDVQGVCIEQHTGDDCTETPDAPECQIDCNATPDAPECQVDCDATPDAPECQIDCDATPDAPECQIDCDATPDAPECQIDCDATPDAPECQVDCDATPDAPECQIDCDVTPDAPECGLVCQAPLLDCGESSCIDTRSNPLHCGGCGVRCDTNTQQCSDGTCYALPEPYTLSILREQEIDDDWTRVTSFLLPFPALVVPDHGPVAHLECWNIPGSFVNVNEEIPDDRLYVEATTSWIEEEQHYRVDFSIDDTYLNRCLIIVENLNVLDARYQPPRSYQVEGKSEYTPMRVGRITIIIPNEDD